MNRPMFDSARAEALERGFSSTQANNIAAEITGGFHDWLDVLGKNRGSKEPVWVQIAAHPEFWTL